MLAAWLLLATPVVAGYQLARPPPHSAARARPVQAMAKPLAARVAELVRGSPIGGSAEDTVTPLPRPASVQEGKTRLCVAGYQH